MRISSTLTLGTFFLLAQAGCGSSSSGGGAIAPVASTPQASTFFRIAGQLGIDGFSGDGGPATLAHLNEPEDIAFSPVGDLFIADTSNHRIRKVNAITGIISTVAGTGVAGFFGDGGLATAARLNGPHDIAFDTLGNLFIADTGNGRVRKVTATTGIIITVAGNGLSTHSGDGGPATAATGCNAQGVAVDSSGNFYFSASLTFRIRKVSGQTGIISTFVGTGGLGSGGDGGPATLATINDGLGSLGVNAAGDVFIAEMDADRIRKVDRQTGIITTVAGVGSGGFLGDGGPATSAQLNEPMDVVFDVGGNLFIADHSNHAIRKIDVQTGIISTVAFDPLLFPEGVALDGAGSVFIADPLNNVVLRVGP